MTTQAQLRAQAETWVGDWSRGADLTRNGDFPEATLRRQNVIAHLSYETLATEADREIAIRAIAYDRVADPVLRAQVIANALAWDNFGDEPVPYVVVAPLRDLSSPRVLRDLAEKFRGSFWPADVHHRAWLIQGTAFHAGITDQSAANRYDAAIEIARARWDRGSNALARLLREKSEVVAYMTANSI